MQWEFGNAGFKVSRFESGGFDQELWVQRLGCGVFVFKFGPKPPKQAERDVAMHVFGVHALLF